MSRFEGWKLTLKIDGDGETVHNVKRIGERAINARPIMRVLNKLIQISAWDQFQTEGNRGGHHWLPDSSTTVEKKQAEGLDTRTERATRDLEASLLKGGRGNVDRMSAHATTFGTRLFYARFQGHKRQLLEVTARDADDWTYRMAHYVLTGEGV